MRDLCARPLRSRWLPALSAVATLAGVGCGDSPTAPSALRSSNQMPLFLTVTGNATLSGIGETSQLAAIANYSDRTTRDVTLLATWQATDQSVVTVSATGLVTVVGFGTSRVSASYESVVIGSVQISAWPPGRFAVSGRVREPGQSGLGLVRVLDSATGLSTMTGRDGGFFLGGIAGPELTFESTSFETVRRAVGPNDVLDVAMQRVIRITAGDGVNGQRLAPHDVSYEVGGDRCYPCRRIRILAAAPATLRFRLTWSDPRVVLNIWAAARRFDGTHPELVVDLPIAAGEFVLYVGMLLPPSADGASDYVSFTLATEFR